MQRPYETFVGIDLGGARGKTTAIARLTLDDSASAGPEIVVHEVSNRHREAEPWHDAALIEYLEGLDTTTVVAINAPLTMPACLRCQLPVCPGKDACLEPAVVWLRSAGQALVARAVESDRDRIVAMPGGTRSGTTIGGFTRPMSRIEPYVHRCCEVVMHYEYGAVPRGVLGMGMGPIAARGVHLRRQLARLGFQLDRNLLEVCARATVHALFGERKARGYRRDADPWHTRAAIVEGLDQLRFALSSRMAREDVLSNDHCFDALLSGYTAYLWARDGWTIPQTIPDDVSRTDGWIWAPSARDG